MEALRSFLATGSGSLESRPGIVQQGAHGFARKIGLGGRNLAVELRKLRFVWGILVELHARLVTFEFLDEFGS